MGIQPLLIDGTYVEPNTTYSDSFSLCCNCQNLNLCQANLDIYRIEQNASFSVTTTKCNSWKVENTYTSIQSTSPMNSLCKSCKFGQNGCYNARKLNAIALYHGLNCTITECSYWEEE